MILVLIGIYVVVVLLACLFSVLMVTGSLGSERELDTVREARQFIKMSLVWPFGLVYVTFKLVAEIGRAIRLLIRAK